MSSAENDWGSRCQACEDDKPCDLHGSSAENGRLVMLNREEVAWICKRIADLSVPQTEERAIGDGILAKVKAAPANPAKAVRIALAAASYTAGAGPVALAALGYGIPGDFDRKVAGVPQRPTPRDETPS